MTRERERDSPPETPFEILWRELSQYEKDELWPHIDAAKKVCNLAHAAGERLGRQRLREELRKLVVKRDKILEQLQWEYSENASARWGKGVRVYRWGEAEQVFQAGERLGRENSDSVYWPALCEQWKIEFGRELGQQGGHIMNIVDSVRELVREEREECAKLAETRFEVIGPGQYRQGSIDTIAEICEAIRARGVAREEQI